MVNRERGARSTWAVGLVDVACAVALAVSLRWTPWRPSGPRPVPHPTEP